MQRARSLDPHGNWRAAIVLGLITGTYSTLVVSLGAEQIGRKVAVDWMVVGTVLLRDAAVEAEPGWAGIAAGILVHQSADFAWAVAFFGLLGRWTRNLGAGAIALLALPWAAFSSATEFYLTLPWLQPLLRVEQPYWIGLTVHAVSSSGYALFSWPRGWVLGQRVRGSRVGPYGAAGMTLALVAVGALFILTRVGRAPAWPGLDGAAQAYQAGFLRCMTAHHKLGVA